jgi:hypothetical protein
MPCAGAAARRLAVVDGGLVSDFFCFGMPAGSFHSFFGQTKTVITDVVPAWERTEHCPLDKKHSWRAIEAVEQLRRARFSYQFAHNRRDMILWGGIDWLLHQQLSSEMLSRGFTGFELVPATVRFRDGSVSEDLYKRVLITGWGGVARPESGLWVRNECPECGRREYGKLTDPTQLIDASQWTGEDFFQVWPLLGDRFISRRVAELWKDEKVRSCTIRPLEISNEIGYPLSLTFDYKIQSVLTLFPERLARKYYNPPAVI